MVLLFAFVVYSSVTAYLGFDEVPKRINKLGRRNNQLEFWVMQGKIFLVTWNIFVVPNKFSYTAYFICYAILSIHEIILVVQHVFFDFKMYIFFMTFFLFEKCIFFCLFFMNMLNFKIMGFDLVGIILIFVMCLAGRISGNIAYKIAMDFDLTLKSDMSSGDINSYKLLAISGYFNFYQTHLANYTRNVNEETYDPELS